MAAGAFHRAGKDAEPSLDAVVAKFGSYPSVRVEETGVPALL